MQRLTAEEKMLLKEYCNGKVVPTNSDPFPKILITPDLKGLNGFFFFLELESLENLNFQDVQSKVLYKCCVKVLNKAILKE